MRLRRGQRLERFLVGAKRVLIEENKGGKLNFCVRPGEMPGDSPDGDCGGFLKRVGISSGADGGEGDPLQPALVRHFETGTVTGGKQFRFAMPAIAINGADGVEDEFRWQLPGAGGDGAAGWAARLAGADLVKFAHHGWTAGAVNRPVDTTSAGQMGIGGVDDGVGGDAGNIAELELEHVSGRKVVPHARYSKEK